SALFAGGDLPSIGITAYGGPGADTLRGSQTGDRLAGGSGDDLLVGNRGADLLFGDAGVNVDVVTRELAVVAVDEVPAALGFRAAVADPLTAGRDTVFGDAVEATAPPTGLAGYHDDVLFGDHGEILADVFVRHSPRDAVVQDAPQAVQTVSRILEVRTVQPVNGAADTLVGGPGNDLLLGGGGGDLIWGDAAFDLDDVDDPAFGGVGADDLIVGDF